MTKDGSTDHPTLGWNGPRVQTVQRLDSKWHKIVVENVGKISVPLLIRHFYGFRVFSGESLNLVMDKEFLDNFKFFRSSTGFISKRNQVNMLLNTRLLLFFLLLIIISRLLE